MGIGGDHVEWGPVHVDAGTHFGDRGRPALGVGQRAKPLVITVTGHKATVEQADLGAGEEDDGGPFPTEPLRTLGAVYKELHQLV
jgi:hypothetical protein